MDIRHTLICVFFFTLRGRNTGLINAEILVSTGKEGGDITVECIFIFSGRRKSFCKEPCEEEDILIETDDVTAKSGRYSIEYDKGTILQSAILYVSITKLTKSDAGKYKCGLHRYLTPSSYQEIEIRVEEAPVSSKPNVTLQPFSASVPSASTLTTTQWLSSSTGSYTPSSASPEGTQQSQKEQTPAADYTLMYVGLTLVVILVVLLAAVLIFCRKRANIPKEPPVETEYANYTEANREYEEIREEDRWSTSPVEVSTVYTYVRYTKPNGVETTDEYSLATAATSQKTIEDASGKLIYSDVDFADGPAASLNSAPRGDADNVVYSVPRVEDTSPPLYSVVTSHQP
ncbi:uncharacterized protein [Cebidichthys violaceus]|uniref:uncharacterized protein isoform X1 n=1 Tax=Cebidichthys violaceus TaxID=271503 RepID=UPI0035CBC580